MTRFAPTCVLIAVALLGTACGERAEPVGALAQTYPVAVHGAGDRPTVMKSRPERIVVLDPGPAETLLAIGAGDRLVGVPARLATGAARRAQEVVRATGQINVDEVVSLEPDLIVATPSIDELDRIPVLTKDDLVEVQAAAPPFGGLLGADASVRRIFQSPGPLYEPELDVPDPWRWRPALEAAGFQSGEIVLNAAGYHLTPLGAMLEEGVRALGGVVVPGGVGNLDLQVRACVDLGATAYVGLPSYLKALLDKADELDLGSSLRLERAFVLAEPLPPSLRALLEERVSVVCQGYGTAEGGNLGYECEQKAGFHVPDDALVEVCAGAAAWMDLPVAGGQRPQVPPSAGGGLGIGTGGERSDDLVAGGVDDLDRVDCGLRTDAGVDVVKRGLDDLPADLVAARLRAYAERTAGGVLDEPATAQALAGFVARGLDCGALDATEVQELTGLDRAVIDRYARRTN